MVLDASAAVRTLVADENGRRMRARIAVTESHAPHVFDAEVGQALRRHARQGALDPAVALDALREVCGLVDHRYSHLGLLSGAWALRHNLSFYDALYASLAAELGMPLVTSDIRLARAPSLPCTVELV